VDAVSSLELGLRGRRPVLVLGHATDVPGREALGMIERMPAQPKPGDVLRYLKSVRREPEHGLLAADTAESPGRGA
jgi:hypothetical protein